MGYQTSYIHPAPSVYVLIPSCIYSRPLHDGDILNIDITVFLNGYHGDTSKTYLVGDVDASGRELIDVTNEALERAIAVCGPGRPFKAIGRAIHDWIANKNYSISEQFTGHGINRVFHCAPWILHHRVCSTIPLSDVC